MLHTVNKSPFERSAFDDCLRHAKPGSVVLLIEDGVYAAMQGTAPAARLQQLPRSIRVLALKADVEARGIRSKLLKDIDVVDYAGFVDLVVEHAPVMSWL
jgi:tRNA 2-thiouridine synthesizing protein B